MTENNKIYAIIETKKAMRKNTCILCGETIFKDSDVVKVTTAKNTFAICPNCYAKHSKIRNSGNTAKNTVGNLTVYNDIIGYTVNVVSEKPETRAYIMCQQGWLFSDHIDSNKFVANYRAVNFQAISPMLDSIYSNDETIKVLVNGMICHNTEEVRDAIDMKVRNAVVNKSVK